MAGALPLGVKSTRTVKPSAVVVSLSVALSVSWAQINPFTGVKQAVEVVPTLGVEEALVML
jgi:hypothetical protein